MAGLTGKDCDRCCVSLLGGLETDNGMVYPCPAYLIHGGVPIGAAGDGLKGVIGIWFVRHNPLEDPICQAHCPEVYSAYNSLAYTMGILDAIDREED